MKRYKIFLFPAVGSSADLEGMLNSWAEEGWKVTAVVPVGIEGAARIIMEADA